MDNPAGRLQHYLELALAQDQQAAAQEGWCGVFGLTHPDDVVVLPRYMAQLVELAQRTRDEVGLLADDDPEVALEHFHEVDRTLSHTIHMGNKKMEWFLSPLTGTGMQSLKLCSSLLHRRQPEPTLSKGDTSGLRDRVSALMEDVRGADDLEADARDAILDKLGEIYETLRDVQLRGMPAVRSAAEAMIGSLLGQRGAWARAAKSSVGTALFEFLIILDILLNLTANYETLAGPSEPSPTIIELWIEVTDQDPPALPSDGPRFELEGDVLEGEVVEEDDGSSSSQ